MGRSIRTNVLMMESDSEDDEEPSADGASQWARQIGESPEDDLVEMLSGVRSASVLATKIREEELKGEATKKTATTSTALTEPSTPKKGKRKSQSEPETAAPGLVTPVKMQMSKTGVDVSDVSTPIRRVAYELAATGAALFTSPSKTKNDDDGTAGSLFVAVKMIRSLNGLFVRINIESGHNLLAMDAGNTSDPYVKVSIINNATGAAVEGQVRRSGYRPKTLNPIWNESFYMGDEKLSFKDYSLKFDVYDFDIMSSDDAMGQAVLPLTHFAKYVNTSKRKRKTADKRERKSLKQLEASQSLASAVTGKLSGEPSQIALKLSETTDELKSEKADAHGERVAFKNGYFVLSHEWEMNVHLKLEKPSQEIFLLQEAKAMLVFAKELVDPRNFGKGIASSSVGNWFNAKVEQAVDVGKRRALKVIDTTVEEKKNKVSALAVADRDMPIVIKQYLGGLINVYLSDIQSELMSSISMRMKITEGAKVAKDSEPKSWKAKERSPFSIKRMFNSMRCWYLYNEVPCDMTIFGKVRNPWWWVSLGTKVYFGLGLQAIVFFIRLCLVDKRDEWQMFEFIAVFKGIQFVSGTISVFSGAWSFIKCAGIIDAGLAHTCDSEGPWVDEMNTCVFNPQVCALLNGGAYLVRILMCWYAFAKLKKSFAFGKAIAGDHRLIGGKILVVFVKPGARKTSKLIQACCAKLAWRSKKPVEEEPLDRFRRIVRTQIDFIYASKGLRGGTERRAGLGKFHYVQRRAKVKDYDPATGLHTIYYKDDKERTLHDVDLSSMTYTVMKLKHLQPRRIQRFLWGYELLTFCITLAITLQFIEWIDWGNGARWQLFLVTYWGQTLYNLLAFPFILMVIPGVNKLVCHAPKTGYNRQTGRLQRFRKRPTFAENVKEEPHPRSRIFHTCYPFSNKLRI